MLFRSGRIPLWLVGAVAVSASACDHAASHARARPAASVRVAPSTVVMPAGGTAQLAAEVADDTGQPIGGADIEFSADDAKITVSATGLVRSEGPLGAARVTVSSGGKAAEVAIRVTPGPPHSIAVIQGGEQAGVVGTPLTNPVVVRILDGSENPVPGAEVFFDAADGGIADPSRRATGADGLASTRWTLGPPAGSQTLSVSLQRGTLPPMKVTAHATSGPAAKLAKVSGDTDGAAAPDENRTLQIRVTDSAGNPVKDAEVRWQVEAGGGRLSSAASITDQGGVARVAFTTGGRPGANRIVARLGELTATLTIDTNRARPR